MSMYSLDQQLKQQRADELAAAGCQRGDREDTGAAMFGAFAEKPKGITFEAAVALAKENGWPVVIHQAGEWAICDTNGSCQIRRDMADRDDKREHWGD